MSRKKMTGSVVHVMDESWEKAKILPFYDILVKDLTYKVGEKSVEKGTTQKVVLNGINAEAFHGQILAIVGPSGSGKTTFLDALAGRLPSSRLGGKVFVNGELTNKSFKRISGYVMQDDALFPMLTVRETLLYSARLRLPSSMPFAEKESRVDDMITQLGIQHCSNTKVGNDRIRGVSGGERRRVSIGADLIHDPAVLILDEPASGLDSTSALNLLEILRRMAQDKGRTVLFSIHQPSYRLLKTIDRVLVLGRGSVIYHGEHNGIKNHFQPLGRQMPKFENVIEYVLDTIDDYQKSSKGLAPLISLQKAMYDEEAARPLKEEEANAADFGTAPVYKTSILSECLVLSERNLKNILRTPILFLSRLGVLLVLSIALGTIFFQLKVSEKGARQRDAWIAFMTALLNFTSIDAMGVYLEDRQIFIRETSRGAYRSGSYVIAGTVVTIPFQLTLALAVSAIGYYIVGLAHDQSAFLVLVVVIWLALSVANSFVRFVSAMVPNFTVGNTLATGCFSFFFLLSGFFIQKDAIPKYWIWCHYISIFRSPYELLLTNEFGSKVYRNSRWGSLGSSEDVLESYSAAAVKQWVNITVMVGMYIFYTMLTWLALRYRTKGIPR